MASQGLAQSNLKKHTVDIVGQSSQMSNLAPTPGCEQETRPQINLTPEDVRYRMTAARALAEAIGDAHPDDAVQLMAAALTDLTHSGKRPDFFLNAEEEVDWWASFEAPEVLVATLAAVLKNLGNRAMHLNTRKRLFWILWQGFSPEVRANFTKMASGERIA
jgi:hypothetical protein